jgi:hypothetical protein
VNDGRSGRDLGHFPGIGAMSSTLRQATGMESAATVRKNLSGAICCVMFLVLCVTD